MTNMITNDALSEKIAGTNAILKRVEEKVDTLANNSVNPQVFELKIKELQVGIATNTVDILEIKKTMANNFESERHREDKKRSKTFGYLIALIIGVSSACSGGFVAWLLNRR
jgi:hypothetical protein